MRHQGADRCVLPRRAPADCSTTKPGAASAQVTGLIVPLGEAPSDRGGSVHHVHAVSSRAIPYHPVPRSRRQAARSPAPTTPFTKAADTQKALAPLGKGLDLRKLVAGAGFELATSGL